MNMMQWPSGSASFLVNGLASEDLSMQFSLALGMTSGSPLLYIWLYEQPWASTTGSDDFLFPSYHPSLSRLGRLRDLSSLILHRSSHPGSE